MENQVRKVVVNKLERLALKSINIYRQIDSLENSDLGAKEMKKLLKLRNDYDKLENELYVYLIEKNVSEDEWYSSETMPMIYDGCEYYGILEDAKEFIKKQK